MVVQPYEVGNCLTARMHKGINSTLDEGQTPVISIHEAPIAAYAQPMPINTMVALRHEALGEGTGFGIGDAGDPAYTLTKGHSHAVAQPIGFNARQDPDHWSGRTGPLDTDGSTQAVAIGWDEELNASTEQSGTLLRGGQGGRHDGVMTPAMQVRRLTPIECERLQGFPDNYTNIPWRKAEQAPDGPRYKALGNSWAVPVVAWIGQRIQEAIK